MVEFGRLLRNVLTALFAVIGLACVSPAPPAMLASPVGNHLIDLGALHENPNQATHERAPPAEVYADNPCNAVDRWSDGASMRPSGIAPHAAYVYDHHASLEKTTQAAGTTGQHTRDADGDLCALLGSTGAARSVDNLPTVHWSQQSKHFPGHPNYIPGRSQLTANPEALIQRAGTGTPVGSVPRGQPGFKERIDFDAPIGTWISRDGATSSPTSIGILHYRADGSVHIIPGRPW